MSTRNVVSNVTSTVVTIGLIALAAYFLIPYVSGCIKGGMESRDTMDRPSSMDLQPGLPSK